MALSLLDGNETAALGAVGAGCRFFAGYPLTPATGIFNAMLRLLPPRGGVCMQGEDEIASIGFCLGASMAGLKCLTATSGPGLSLYSEQISFAIASEIPLVIIDVQRLGPSTGSATSGADGDIQFMRWGNSGGLPVIVLSAADAADCYVLTAQAFNLAEKFRCPVFVASNKEIATTKESVDLDALKLPDIVERAGPPAGETFLPFKATGGRKVPYFLPIGGEVPVRQTSSSHGPDGYYTTDPEVLGAIRERLRDKIEGAVGEFSFYEEYTDRAAETLVLTYGVTSRAARQVFENLQGTASPVSVLALKTLWPVPAGLIREKAGPYSRVLVVEMNLGQYAREIERILPDKKVDFFGQMNSKLITPDQIREAAHGQPA